MELYIYTLLYLYIHIYTYMYVLILTHLWNMNWQQLQRDDYDPQTYISRQFEIMSFYACYNVTMIMEHYISI